MLHALRFAMDAEDGSTPLPLTRTWFVTDSPFSTSLSPAPVQPYAEYNGTRVALEGSVAHGFRFRSTYDGIVSVVADDVLTAMTLSDPDLQDAGEFSGLLRSVESIGTRVVELGDYCFFRCARLGPVFSPSYYGPGIRLGDGCFEGCSGITGFSRRFLSKVVSAGARTFAGCTSLETLDGMSSFDPIGWGCFQGCVSLMSLVGGFSSPTEIGGSCFEGCSSLESLDGIPRTVEALGEACFRGCSALSDILALSETSIGSVPDFCFEGCSSLPSPHGIPDAVTRVGKRGFARSGVESLTGVPDSVVLETECFAECLSLRGLVDPPSVSDFVGAGVFRDCYWSLSSPGSVSTEGGLEDISGFTSMTAGPKVVPERCFQGDRFVKRLPDMTELSGLVVLPYAFSGCSGLLSIEGLPSDVVLSEGAFSDCYTPPHDWYVENALADDGVEKTTRFCGLSVADMSGLSTDTLPDSCFENCAALPDLPPLPPAAMKFGDRCFSGCTGIKSLASLDGLSVRVTCGSSYYDGETYHHPTYPSFGEWCFSRCGTNDGSDTAGFVYGNDPSNPPDLGVMKSLSPGLKTLCDRLEFEAVTTMAASSTDVLVELFEFARSICFARLPDVVDSSLLQYVGQSGELWNVQDSFGLVLAGLVSPASHAAATGYTVYYGELKEVDETFTQILGVNHVVIGVSLPVESGDDLYHVRFFCPGVDADVTVVVPATVTDGEVAADVPYGDYVIVRLAVKVSNGDLVEVGASVERNGGPFAPTRIDAVVPYTKLFEDKVEPAQTAAEAASGFMRLMLYFTMGLHARSGDHASFAGVSLGTLVNTLVENFQVTEGQVLSKLRELNLVTPAPMLSDHCFDGCSNLESGFPTMIVDVPQYCFAGTAFESLTEFSHVDSVGIGAFSGSKITSTDGFPPAVPFVATRMFDGCEGLTSATSVPRRASVYGSYAFNGCTSLTSVSYSGDEDYSWDEDAAGGLYVELCRLDGVTRLADITTELPCVSMFTGSRAVRTFSASCFCGCSSLTDASFMRRYDVPELDDVIRQVESAVSSRRILTSTVLSNDPMMFDIVIKMTDGRQAIIRFTDGGLGVDGPPGFTDDGSPSGRPSVDVMTVGLVTGGSVGLVSGDVAVRPYSGDAGVYSSHETNYWSIGLSRWRDEGEELRIGSPSVSDDGFIRILVDAYGHVFSVDFSVSVTRNVDALGHIVSVFPHVDGARVSYTGKKWPGYPDFGGSVTHSLVPLLNDVGTSCFEGCTGLSSLGWIPLGVTRFPARCFANVPFTHEVETEDGVETENSVVVPPWVTEIGTDCFISDADSDETLEALYLHGTADEIRAMRGFPWGVPSGCVIYTVDGVLVYTAS